MSTNIKGDLSWGKFNEKLQENHAPPQPMIYRFADPIFCNAHLIMAELERVTLQLARVDPAAASSAQGFIMDMKGLDMGYRKSSENAIGPDDINNLIRDAVAGLLTVTAYSWSDGRRDFKAQETIPLDSKRLITLCRLALMGLEKEKEKI